MSRLPDGIQQRRNGWAEEVLATSRQSEVLEYILPPGVEGIESTGRTCVAVVQRNYWLETRGDVRLQGREYLRVIPHGLLETEAEADVTIVSNWMKDEYMSCFVNICRENDHSPNARPRSMLVLLAANSAAVTEKEEPLSGEA